MEGEGKENLLNQAGETVAKAALKDQVSKRKGEAGRLKKWISDGKVSRMEIAVGHRDINPTVYSQSPLPRKPPAHEKYTAQPVRATGMHVILSHLPPSVVPYRLRPTLLSHKPINHPQPLHATPLAHPRAPPAPTPPPPTPPLGSQAQ
jgi:hypothetical protein